MSAKILREELVKMDSGQIRKNVGICVGIYDAIKAEHGIQVGLECLDYLKTLFVKLGLSEKYPVEFQFLKKEEEAYEEHYHGGPKWSPKTVYGKARLDLVKQLIRLIDTV